MNLEQFKNRKKKAFSGTIIIDDLQPVYSKLKNKRTTPKGIYGIRRKQKIEFYFNKMLGKRINWSGGNSDNKSILRTRFTETGVLVQVDSIGGNL